LLQYVVHLFRMHLFLLEDDDNLKNPSHPPEDSQH